MLLDVWWLLLILVVQDGKKKIVGEELYDISHLIYNGLSLFSLEKRFLIGNFSSMWCEFKKWDPNKNNRSLPVTTFPVS